MERNTIYQNEPYANFARLDPARHAWRPRPPARRPRANWPGASTRTARARLDRAREGRKPSATAPSSAPVRASAPRARPRPRAPGGAAASGRRPHCVRSPHLPALQSPIRWTEKGGHNGKDRSVQRCGVQNGRRGVLKCSGWHRRRAHGLIGFSVISVSSENPVGNGRADGARDGTWRRRGSWPSRRHGAGTSGWRGTCRSSRLRIAVLPRKKRGTRTRESETWFAGVGRAQTQAGRRTGSRRAGGARGRRSRASSVCRTRGGVTLRCGWRSVMRSAKRCRGRFEDPTEAGTMEGLTVVSLGKRSVIGDVD